MLAAAVPVRAPRALFVGCAIAAVATGVILAARRAWMCDDAFITFRYADNLVRGHGLVFNAGERVEGFTNLLWTLWTALGLRLGVSAEVWAGASGIACFAATLALLARRGGAIASASRVAWPLPAAAILAAIHHEWTVFATSGLETSAFTLLAFAGYVLVCPTAPAGPAWRARPARSVSGGVPVGGAGGDAGVASADGAGGDAGAVSVGGAGDDAGAAQVGGAGGDAGAVSVGGAGGDAGAVSVGGAGGDAGAAQVGGAGGDAGAASVGGAGGDAGAASVGGAGGDAGAASVGGAGGDAGAVSVDGAGGDAGAAPRAGLRRLALAGGVLALASLTRPDGVLFAAVCGVWLLAGRDLRGALALAGGFAALWLPATVARIAYYGDVFPNTYYAKSAAIAWWSQGAYYAWTYAVRYWPLALALPLAALVRPRRPAALALALAGVYIVYVMRVGGDFMFGRLLLPVAPFLLIAIERGLIALLGGRPVLRAAALAGLAAALVVTPSAVDQRRRPRGIADEHYAYTVELAGWAERADGNGATLARLFDGLPVTVCFFGAQARLVYRSRVATAIECETGLTDATIAHQALAARGRIGHEKHAQLPYLLARRVDFVLTRDWANEVLHLDDQLPDVPIELGRIRGRVITWHPAIMAALAARGVRTPDVPGQIDRTIAALPGMSDAAVRRDWERLRRLYFDRGPDPAREAPFRARLGISPDASR